jgi:hypothetical protein
MYSSLKFKGKQAKITNSWQGSNSITASSQAQAPRSDPAVQQGSKPATANNITLQQGMKAASQRQHYRLQQGSKHHVSMSSNSKAASSPQVHTPQA